MATESRRVGGGILAAVGILAPWVANMMGLTLSREIGYPLLALCGLAFVVGLVMVFWPALKETPPITKSSHVVISHDQSGGITAHTVTGAAPDGGRQKDGHP